MFPAILPFVLQLPALYEGAHKVSHELADLVGDLQSFLHGLGYRPLRVDENFGSETRTALKAYQRAKLLVQDARVGPKTWGALLGDGFRPRSWVEDEQGYAPEKQPNWPPKPAGSTSPNGMLLFGQGLTFTPNPSLSVPEGVKLDPKWVSENIITVTVEQLKGVQGARADGKVQFNRHVAQQLLALFRVWQLQGFRPLTFAGTYAPRYVRGRTDLLSNHAVGSAFDINVAWNGYRSLPALYGDKGSVRVGVPAAYALGFYWGGWFNDGMHFEAYKKIEPEELKRIEMELIK